MNWIKLAIALFWVAVIVLLTSLFWLGVFYAAVGEAEYRSSRAENQQIRAHLRKIPSIYKAHKQVEDCALVDEYILCIVRRGGVQSQAVYK